MFHLALQLLEETCDDKRNFALSLWRIAFSIANLDPDNAGNILCKNPEGYLSSLSDLAAHYFDSLLRFPVVSKIISALVKTDLKLSLKLLHRASPQSSWLYCLVAEELIKMDSELAYCFVNAIPSSILRNRVKRKMAYKFGEIDPHKGVSFATRPILPGLRVWRFSSTDVERVERRNFVRMMSVKHGVVLKNLPSLSLNDEFSTRRGILWDLATLSTRRALTAFNTLRQTRRVFQNAGQIYDLGYILCKASEATLPELEKDAEGNLALVEGYLHLGKLD